MRHAHSASKHSQHTFSLAPQANTPRSSFNLSHSHKTTFNEGYLIPIFVDEVLPGDTLNVNLHALVRMATPIYPIMDNLYFETFWFFTANRLLWEHWQQFNGAQLSTPSDTTDYILPTLTSGATGFVASSISDYFGLPTDTTDPITVMSLAHRCYNLVYNQWFLDQNLQDALTVQIDDGPDTLANYVLQRRGKRFDYFTSCLPWTQKINDGTVVEIPLGTTAPIITTGANPTFVGSDAVQRDLTMTITTAAAAFSGTAPGASSNMAFGTTTGLEANLASATAASINQLRQAFQLQVLFEADARGGTRYPEIIKAHFNVSLPDMQWRPEVLACGSHMININPVTQNAPPTETDDTPQGNLAAFGVGHISGHGFTKSFVEHGIVMGIACVRADLTYQQGIPRWFSRSTRYDFYWPALAHIGEQAVLLQEIYAMGVTADTNVFGYQERYAEYRFKPSKITGLFRTNAAGTLDAWHLSQFFSTAPALNSTFIVEDAPMSRIEAVAEQPDFICDMFFDYKAARVMPVYGTPMSLGRF